MREMTRRGDIWLVDLDPTIGHEINKTRPAVIIQNDIHNEYSKLTIIAPLTSKNTSSIYPTEVLIPKEQGVETDSKILLSQIRTVDKRRLVRRVGRINSETQAQIDEAIRISLGLVKIE